MSKNPLIVFEGIETSGKSTSLKKAIKYLKRYSLRDVVNLISEKNKLPKKEIYNLCMQIKK